MRLEILYKINYKNVFFAESNYLLKSFISKLLKKSFTGWIKRTIILATIVVASLIKGLTTFIKNIIL